MALNDQKTDVLVERVKRVALRRGLLVRKLHRAGFVVSDVHQEKVVLGGDQPSGATLKELMAFLEVAA